MLALRHWAAFCCCIASTWAPSPHWRLLSRCYARFWLFQCSSRGAGFFRLEPSSSFRSGQHSTDMMFCSSRVRSIPVHLVFGLHHTDRLFILLLSEIVLVVSARRG